MQSAGRAQGALEYILLIGGVILVSVIVISLIRTSIIPSSNQTMAANLLEYNLILNITPTPTATATPTPTPSPTPSGTLIWSYSSNPGAGTEIANSISADGGYLYVAGLEGGFARWRVEKLFASNASNVWNYSSDPNPLSIREVANSVFASGNYVYVAGNRGADSGGFDSWRVEKLFASNATNIWNYTVNGTLGNVIPQAVFADGGYVYVAGTANASSITSSWRVEKLDASTSESIWNHTMDTPGAWDEASSVFVDGGYVYVAGNANNYDLRVEKLYASNGSNVWNYTGASAELDNPYPAFVDSGYVYVAGVAHLTGQWQARKLYAANGSVVWSYAGGVPIPTGLYSACFSSGAVYLAGVDQVPGNNEIRMEKLAAADGSNVLNYTSNPTTSEDYANSIAADSAYVYLAGNSNNHWLVEKVAK